MISDIPVPEQAATLKKGSPWSGLGRMLTDVEWEALKEWRKDNPGLRFRANDVRSDGRVFDGYARLYHCGERWLTPEKKLQYKKVYRENRRKLYTDPARRAKKAEKARKRYRNDASVRLKYKEYGNKWRAENPERNRANAKAWFKMKFETDSEYRKKTNERHRLRRESMSAILNAKLAEKRAAGLGAPADTQKKCPLLRRIYQHASQIQKRLGIEMEVDHIIPVRHGGPHMVGNLQILTGAVNRQKGGNPFWMSPDGLSRDFRDVPRHLWPEKLRPEYERLVALHPKLVYARRPIGRG